VIANLSGFSRGGNGFRSLFDPFPQPANDRPENKSDLRPDAFARPIQEIRVKSR
jgi:hypothetical protein